MSERIMFLVRLLPELHDWLKGWAKRKGMSLNAALNFAVSRLKDEEEKNTQKDATEGE